MHHCASRSDSVVCISLHLKSSITQKASRTVLIIKVYPPSLFNMITLQKQKRWLCMYLTLVEARPGWATWQIVCRLWSIGRCTLGWEISGLIAVALEGRTEDKETKGGHTCVANYNTQSGESYSWWFNNRKLCEMNDEAAMNMSGK